VAHAIPYHVLSGSPRVEGFVSYFGRRIGCGFCSSHLEESLKIKKRKEENEGSEEGDGVT